MKRLFVLLCLVLASCFPGATLSPGGPGLEFVKPEDRPAAFAAVILGEPAEVNDPRCDVYEAEHPLSGYTCDLGVLEPDEAIAPIRVAGARLSCEVYRLPVLKVYPCQISEE